MEPRSSSEDPIEEVERRAAAPASEPAFSTLRAFGLYPLLALAGLAIARQLIGSTMVVLGPEISRDLGISKESLAGIGAIAELVLLFGTIPATALVRDRPRRVALILACGVVWSACIGLLGTARAAWQFALLRMGHAASGSIPSVAKRPLLVDLYPPAGRMRALSGYEMGGMVGAVLVPLLVLLVVGPLGLSWRELLIGFGLLSFLLVAAASGLRDPGVGRWETGGRDVAVAARLGFGETFRRVWLIPTVRRMLVTDAVLGAVLIPLNTFLYFFLRDRWGLDPQGRALFFAAMPVFAIASLALFAKRAEARFRRDPAGLVDLAARMLIVGLVGIAIGIGSPSFPGVVVGFAIAFASTAALGPPLNLTMLSMVPPEARAHLSALSGIFVAGVGGLGGLLLLSGVDDRFGEAGAIGALIVPGIGAALLLRSARRTVVADLEAAREELAQRRAVRELLAEGRRFPLLDCRGISFAYPQRRALTDVDLSIEEGEIVALLGTNGAGKSTLLRVIAGLELPQRGVVRWEGEDVTYVDAEIRIRRGIAFVPGGRSVFEPLTVAENLRLFAREMPDAAGRVEEALAAFPLLAKLRDRPAAALSGGERHMLGLAQAVVRRPRLLLVDELSLGVAPQALDGLYDVIQTLNEAGTSVVLVEQSPARASRIAGRACFLDRGTVRFAGPTEELLRRDDLLRPVYLPSGP